MKKLNSAHKLIILAVFIIIVAILAAVVIFVGKAREDTSETVAMVVLSKTYNATLQDYENLNNTTQGVADSGLVLDYFHTLYGEQLTENGYKTFISNRIPNIATNMAHKENSDIKVTSIELEPKTPVQGSQSYFFTIQAQTEKDVSKSLTFTGNITLVRENGQWKVDGASPH